MGGTTLHAGIASQWFEILLMLCNLFEDMLLLSSMGFDLV